MNAAVALIPLLVWSVAAGPAAASDPLPAPAHTSVNDFAAILTAGDAQVLDEALIALHAATGIEGTVITLPDRARYGDATLEAFATRLFDEWGIGDAGRNDGFMVLMAMAEREVRIELGQAYPPNADIRAGDIIREAMIPRLRQGNASAALREGTLGVIETVATPQAARRPVPLERTGGGSGGWLLKAAVFGVLGFSGFGILRGWLRRRRLKTCPRCGGASLTDGAEAGAQEGGQDQNRHLSRRCPDCGWSQRHALPVEHAAMNRGSGAQRPWRHDGSSGRSGDFGGGRSGGGGASGQW